MTNRAYERDDSASGWSTTSLLPRKSVVHGGDWRIFTSNSAGASATPLQGLFDMLAGQPTIPSAIDFPLHGSRASFSPGPDHKLMSEYELQMKQFVAEEDESIRRINKEYLLENRPEVEMFIRNHRSTLAVLLDAVPRLKAAFGADALLHLRLGTEEGMAKVICGVVIWRGSVSTAKTALSQFDDSWWMDNIKRASGRIVFDYELA